MKKYFILLLMVLLVGCSDQSRNYNEFSLDMLGLKGQIKTIEQVCMKDDQHEQLEFVENGYYTSGMHKTEYDEEGNVLISTDMAADGTRIVDWIYDYNDTGQLIQFTADFDDSISVVKYVTEKEIIDDDRVEGQFYAMIEDKKDLESTQVEIFSDGQLIQNTTYDLNSEITYQMNYEYNDDGYIVKFWTTDGETRLETCTIAYELNRMKSYVFETSYFTDVVRFEYLEFDEYDNWTKLEVTKNNDIYILTRKYTYY